MMHSQSLFQTMLCLAAAVVLFSPVSAQDRWEATSGPYGGAVLEVIPLDAQTLLAGTNFGGLYRSDDGGLHWAQAGLAEMAVNVIHRVSGSRLLAGCQNEIVVSTDNGVSWGPITASPEGFILSIDDDGNGTWFAAGREGVFRSFDGGDTWEPLDAGANGARGLCVCAGEDETVFAGFNSAGLRRSTNSGDTWESAGTVFDDEQVQTIARKGRTLIASVWLKGFYYSTDNGQTWENRNGGVTDLRANTFLFHSSGDLLAGTYNGEMWRSTDAGSNWTRSNYPTDGGGIVALREMPDGTLFCGTGGDGVLRSSDGGQQWVQSSNGIMNLMATDMLDDNQGTLYVAFRSRHLLKTANHGDTWTEADDIFGGRLLACDASGTVYRARDYVGVAATTDGGVNWSDVGDAMDRPRFRCFAAASDGHVYAALLNAPNVHLPHGSDAWQEFGTPLAEVPVALLHCAGETVFAAVPNDGMYRSTDGAQSWMKCENGLTATAVGSITGGEEAVFVGTPDGVFRSLDAGASWEQYGPAPGKMPRTLAFLQDSSLLASFDDGVFALGNANQDWGDFMDGLPRIPIAKLCTGREGAVYAMTTWHGVYRHFSPPVHASAPPLAVSAQLEPIHPNPVHDLATIRFALQKAMTISLTVTDLLGRALHRIVDERQYAAGMHVLSFHASALPAGAYLVQLRAADVLQTTTMILLR